MNDPNNINTQKVVSGNEPENLTPAERSTQARPQRTDDAKDCNESGQMRKQAASPLRSGNFILLIAGQGLSLFGNTMLRFAMSMWVLDKTGSATIFATLLSLSIVPTILLMPFGGVVADRVNRRTMMVALDAVSGCVVLAATLAFGFMQTHTIVSIAVLLIALSALNALESPTVSAAIPQMLGRKDIVLLRRAQAISSQVNSIMQIIPTFAGGALYALIGIRTMMGSTTICFFATAGLECFIKLGSVRHYKAINENMSKSPSDKPTKAHHKTTMRTAAENTTNVKDICQEPTAFSVTAATGDSELSESQTDIPVAHTSILKLFLADVRDAAAFLKTNPTLLELVAVTAALNFFLNGVSSVGSPYIIRTTLNFGADVYGYSDGIMSVVSLLDTLLTTALAAKLFMHHLPATIYSAALCFAPIAVIFALPVSRWAKLVTFIAAFCLVTLSIDFTNIIATPTFMTLIPDELMGKIGAFISAVSLCAAPLGQMTYGLLFDRIAVTPIMAGTGICLALGAFVLTPMCKRFGKTDTQHEDQQIPVF
ncbi:MFS transporter [Bifidobacterium sp. ESL0728]|uniref:MFS transporter n=1 Tax=Bifidobacterium sp. ESL0728 TaxID=2983220 RepID=UPI0023F9308A|nr:MFS transporter [Bifidobacterium sp. ESL0728]WEV58796.1 MFS transporter [Bifidobacterium sp. ESL0728]